MSEKVVYFIQVGDDGPIKIGSSSNAGGRLATLQNGHYERLHLIGTTPGGYVVESVIHQKLAQFVIRGEWYAAVPEVLAEIQEPMERIHDALDLAVVAREHLQRAIALFRGADPERGHEELRSVERLINEALEAERADA